MVNRQRIKWLLPGVLLLDVPFVYEFGIHPLFGFLAAILVSWLIIEDFYDLLIDLRVAGSLLLLVLLWNMLKGPDYLFHAGFTFLGFAIGFYALRTLFVKFVPTSELEEPTEGEEASSLGSFDNLQEGANAGLLPIMGLAVFLVLTADMIFNPMQMVAEKAFNGTVWASRIWDTHVSMVQLGLLLSGNKWMTVLAVLVLAGILGLLAWRVRRQIRKKMVPFYPCGAGDPIVIGVFAAMIGAECFYFGVMMLTLVFGIMVHMFRFYQAKKDGGY